MESWIDLIAVLLVLTNLWLLGTSRLAVGTKAVALQAVLLGAIGVLMNAGVLGVRPVAVIGVTTLVKAMLLPWLLRRAAREAGVQRELEPLVGFTGSMMIGVALLGVCFLIARPLHLPQNVQAGILIPVAMFTIITGLFMIVSRKKALTQVLGYLAMENGIYAFGAAFALREPLLVEMGVLLDVFVGVFVMGIAIYHISREFDHIDTDRLSALRD
jgi:hydrogenase-4 component E